MEKSEFKYSRPIDIPEGYVLQGTDSRGGEVWGPSPAYEAARAAERLEETERLARARRLAARAEALGELQDSVA